MLPGLDEPQAFQPVRQLGAEAFINGELKKFDAVVLAGLRCFEKDFAIGDRRRFLLETLAGLLFQIQQ
ncbi:hypothetical protein D3C81_2151180 [compost metagenome]